MNPKLVFGDILPIMNDNVTHYYSISGENELHDEGQGSHWYLRVKVIWYCISFYLSDSSTFIFKFIYFIFNSCSNIENSTYFISYLTHFILSAFNLFISYLTHQCSNTEYSTYFISYFLSWVNIMIYIDEWWKVMVSSITKANQFSESR